MKPALLALAVAAVVAIPAVAQDQDPYEAIADALHKRADRPVGVYVASDVRVTQPGQARRVGAVCPRGTLPAGTFASGESSTVLGYSIIGRRVEATIRSNADGPLQVAFELFCIEAVRPTKTILNQVSSHRRGP